MEFETQKVHGYKIADIETAWEKIRFNEGARIGEMIDVLTPTQYKAVGMVTFVFDGENWVLKEIKL